jgi:hypothetical protein
VLPNSRSEFSKNSPQRLTTQTKEKKKKYRRHLRPLNDLLANGDPATALKAAPLSFTRPPPMAQTLHTYIWGLEGWSILTHSPCSQYSQ